MNCIVKQATQYTIKSPFTFKILKLTEYNDDDNIHYNSKIKCIIIQQLKSIMIHLKLKVILSFVWIQRNFQILMFSDKTNQKRETKSKFIFSKH